MRVHRTSYGAEQLWIQPTHIAVEADEKAGRPRPTEKMIIATQADPPDDLHVTPRSRTGRTDLLEVGGYWMPREDVEQLAVHIQHWLRTGHLDLDATEARRTRR